MSFNTVNPSTGAITPIPGTETSLAPYGAGYATCSTAESTTVKEATLSDYKLRANGYVSVKFTHAVPASATLRVNNTGGVSGIPIYYRGAAITAGVIKAGDVATFIFDGTNYNLIGRDSESSEIQALENKTDTSDEVNNAVNYIYPNSASGTQSGVTYALTENNSINISSNGVVPSSTTSFGYRDYNASFLVGKKVKFKATVYGSSYTNSDLYFVIICRETESGANLYRYDMPVGEGEHEFTVPNNTKVIMVNVIVGSSATAAISCNVAPMLCLASYNGPYVPYAMTNREITDKLAFTTASNPISSTKGTFDFNDAVKRNGIIQVGLQIHITEQLSSYSLLATISSEYAPFKDITAVGYMYRATESKEYPVTFVFKPSGQIQNVEILKIGDIIRFSAVYIGK